ncbi:hypothetical protein DNTS_011006 [Danionella cerebrum]|uniref:Uncharacterized protein n=1 Tax=Danionella cerebrum TaxID=2873325 RepID=A0A553MNY8_9TELE|nr:hypothetical protein DNTS_011006 [Danionella translucida]
MSATISLEERDEEPEDEAEDLPDGGIPFIVNRGGLPMNEETWEQMWSHATRIHPEGEKLGRRIRGNLNLPKTNGKSPIPRKMVGLRCSSEDSEATARQDISTNR